jgi:vacuolar-type H+-ATPase subunit E/Vma4
VRLAGSAASVVEALRDEAAAEIEALEHATEEEIRLLRSAAEAEPPPDAGLEARLAVARREAAQRLAREDIADRRGALEERERWIARAAALGQERLAQAGDTAARRELVLNLAREALASLPGENFRISVLPADAPLLDEGWKRAVAGPSRRFAISSENPPPGGGCLVCTEDGRVSFDNSFAARARRFETTWRAELARVFPT